MSPLLDYSLTEKSARTRTDTTTTPSAFPGTDGSNPVPPSGESANSRSQRELGSSSLPSVLASGPPIHRKPGSFWWSER
jgi:hypothetical protein